ncbi:helix-turn-helix transcriptional regulator [Halorussus ruber]|uniref:helix-turn-helix transcriptional regulator n=1 Tax=Halorussus ruber TaxID=1126238 RepID=UPI001091D6C0|nr:hypothetical protein [Halorussus ruber]
MRMLAETDASDVLATVNKRQDLLKQVASGVQDRQELASLTESSKTTVYRGLDQLEEQDLVTERNGHYRPTEFGKWLSENFEALAERTELAFEHRQFLRQLPMTFEPKQFSTGETYHSTTYDPQAASRALTKHISNQSPITIVTPTIQRDVLDGICGRLGRQRLEVEHVTSEQVLTVLSEEYDDYLNHDNVDVKISDSFPEIGLYRTSDTVALTTFSEEYHPTSVHITNADAVVTAVESLIEEYRDAARPRLVQH